MATVQEEVDPVYDWTERIQRGYQVRAGQEATGRTWKVFVVVSYFNSNKNELYVYL